MKNIAKNIIKLIIIIFIWPWESFRDNTKNPVIPFSFGAVICLLLLFKYGLANYRIFIGLFICICVFGFGYPILSIFLRELLNKYGL